LSNRIWQTEVTYNNCYQVIKYFVPDSNLIPYLDYTETTNILCGCSQISRAFLQGKARGLGEVQGDSCWCERNAMVRRRWVDFPSKRSPGIVFGGRGQAKRTSRCGWWLRWQRSGMDLPVPDRTVDWCYAIVETHSRSRRTNGRPVPRWLQSEQSAVSVRRRRPSGGRSGVRHGHHLVRVAGPRPVILPVHECGPPDPGRSLGRVAGCVLLYAGRGCGWRPGAGPRSAGRRSTRIRVLRSGACVVLRTCNVGGNRSGGLWWVNWCRWIQDVEFFAHEWRWTGHRMVRRRRSTLYPLQVRQGTRFQHRGQERMHTGRCINIFTFFILAIGSSREMLKTLHPQVVKQKCI